MGVFQNNLMGAAAAAASAGGGGFYSHQIANSMRFAGVQDLDRSRSSAGSTTTSSISFWVKRSKLGAYQYILHAYADGNNYVRMTFLSDDTLEFQGEVGGAMKFELETKQVFRDPSAWYHIVGILDFTNGTQGNRAQLYVNGERVTAFDTETYPADASQTNVLCGANTIRYGDDSTNSYILYSYLAEIVLIDGTAQAVGDFGETKNGVWIPKDPSGLTFGTTGHYLKFESSSDLGNDSSGNNNDFTPYESTGAHDQMLDSPTFNSDSNGGNFATYNFLNKGSYTDLSEGNCRADSNTGADASYPSGNFAMTSGKWYYEQLIGNLTNSYPSPGLVACNNVKYDLTRGMFYAMRLRSDTGVAQQNSGDNIAPFGTITVNTTGVASVGTGDIVSWYVDMDNKKAWFAKNGTIANSGDPANGTNPQFSWTENPPGGITFMSQEYQTSFTVVNAGQDGTFAGAKTAQGNSDDTGYGNFYYDPPTGFLALCSGNLPLADAINPAETDDDYPQKLFTALAYSGDGGGSQTTGFQPDLVWVKARNTGQSHGLFDSSRGTSKVLNSNSTSEEISSSGLTSFNSTGYTMGNFYNQSGNTYASWSWRANGGTTSTDSNGSVSSTVQADPSGSFSIVKFIGNISSAGTETVGHGLNKAPSFIINFCYDDLDGGDGNRWTRADGLTNWNYVLKLNATDDQIDKSGNGDMSAPTSTVFSINNTDILGAGSQKIISYCFANCEGYIKSGTYIGNGSGTDGTFVYTGFKPAWVMVKKLAVNNWRVQDNARDPYNPAYHMLVPNSSAAEDAYTDGTDYNDFLSNGFKVARGGDAVNWNANGSTYLFLAMAHNPFKYATAR